MIIHEIELSFIEEDRASSISFMISVFKAFSLSSLLIVKIKVLSDVLVFI